jgi:predicted ribosome quality control (RQC) complex YloA/Tae2 family protein
VPVVHTLRKYVRKPRRSAPGAVVYEREKTLFVPPVVPEGTEPA